MQRSIARATGALRAFLVCLGLSAWCGSASALPAAVVAPGAAGQSTLAVGIFGSGELRALLCPTPACDASRGQPVALPAELAPLLSAATFEVIKLGQGHQVVHLVIPDPSHSRAYEVLLAAPLQGGAGLLVLYEGYTGLVSGEDGAREGPMVFVSEPTGAGERRVVLGKQYETISLCGRPTVLAPQLLNPKDLKLYPAKVQRLSARERDAAVRRQAERLPPDHVLGPSVLKAVGASSAIGAPQNLTDGDLATGWSENRGAEGRGEFVTLNAPPQLPISGFDFVVRPSANPPPANGASPSEFWLATRDGLFHVAMPEDAWQQERATYRVLLDHAVQTDCVALVVENGYGKGAERQVTFAEFTAVTEFDPADLPGLVGALAGGGQRAEAAKMVLMAGGPQAFEAVAKVFSELDEGGRRVALDVMDQAACEMAMPTYVKALLGRYEAHSIHARDRIRRCGRKSADELGKTLRIAVPRARPILANELGLVAPDQAIREILPFLDDEVASRRSAMRIALARAAADPVAKDAVDAALRDTSVSDRARLDLMRALGTGLAEHGAAANEAFARLSTQQDFRTQYLLLGPAAALSAAHAPARNFLGRTLTSASDPNLRFGAALAAEEARQLSKELLGATNDQSVRVRKVAVEALGKRREAQAEAVLLERLRVDAWPMVRAAAADALAGLGSSPRVDQGLIDALDDGSPLARAQVAAALGQRRTQRAVPDLRKRLEDDKEDPRVRGAAAEALGQLCDRESLDLLTELAVKRADPLLEPPQKGLASAALRALSLLGPSDLRQRLAPLFARNAAPGARDAAEQALLVKPHCAKAR